MIQYITQYYEVVIAIDNMLTKYISEPQHATLLCANELYAGGFTERLLLKISKGFQRNNSRGNQSTAQIQPVKLPFNRIRSDQILQYTDLSLFTAPPPKKTSIWWLNVLHQRVRRVIDLCLEFHREAK